MTAHLAVGRDGPAKGPEGHAAPSTPAPPPSDNQIGAPKASGGRQPFTTTPACEPWGGHPRLCQEQAHGSLRSDGYRHLETHAPRRIEYPAGICVYCGELGGSKDHLLPKPWTGLARRQWIATVPACIECNSVISDFGAFSIGERREYAHRKLRIRYAKVLRIRSEIQTAGMGHALRAHCRKGIAEKEALLRRLEWPADPTYDERAFQRSGIAEPADLGLL